MGKGKQRIDIKHIVDKSKRRVTFSKRRQGLFKKAVELDTLCGSRTSVVSVSDAGTVFTAGSIHPSLIHQLLLPHRLMGGLEMMGFEELGMVLATLKKAQESMESLLEKEEEEKKEEEAAAARFSIKDPTFANGITTTSLSGVSTFGYSGGYSCDDFEKSIFGYAEIEDLQMGEDGCRDLGEFGTVYAALEDLNSFQSDLMYLL